MREIQDDGDSPVRAVQIEAVLFNKLYCTNSAGNTLSIYCVLTYKADIS